METLNHTVTLGMKTRSLDLGVPEDGTNFTPDQGHELGTSVRGQESLDSKPRNQEEMKALAQASVVMEDRGTTSRYNGGSVHHGEDIIEPMTQGQIQMYMRESSTRDQNPWNWRPHVSLDLTLLTTETRSCP